MFFNIGPFQIFFIVRFTAKNGDFHRLTGFKFVTSQVNLDCRLKTVRYIALLSRQIFPIV